MANVTALGYVRFGAPDLDAWRTFGTEVLGLQVADGLTDDRTLYLKQDERSYRIAVEQAGSPSTTFGWEVPNSAALQALAAKLDAAGVAVTEASAEHAQSRRAVAMMLCTDPAGNACEFFYGATSDKATFVSPLGARFITGDMGLGHAFVMVPDAKAYLAFYSLLGFEVSDYIRLGPLLATFMHCNERHHTLAFAEVPGTSMLQHVMVEVDSMDTVGRSYDTVLAGAAPIVSTLGRHTNDHMFSFYAASPGGVAFEFGHGGIHIDNESWTVQYFDAPSYWGHARPPKPPK
jgi:2,3-dihydroxybiphenyl 1,2-dioxygenase